MQFSLLRNAFRAARIIIRCSWEVRSGDILDSLNWDTLEKTVNLKKNLVLKVTNGKAPKYMEDLSSTNEKITSLVLRDDENKLVIPFPKTDSFKRSFSYSGAIL